MNNLDKIKRVIAAANMEDSTPTEIADVITLHLSTNISKLETVQSDEDFLESVDITKTLIGLLDSNEFLSDDFKAKVKEGLMEELSKLDITLNEIIANANEIHENLKDKEMNEVKKETVLGKVKSVVDFVKEHKVKTLVYATAAVATVVVGHQVYRHYNPKDVMLNLTDVSVLTDDMDGMVIDTRVSVE